jgi:hypothetical protein
MNKIFVSVASIIVIRSAIKFAKRAYRVSHDPKVIDAWDDVKHDVGIAFNRSYRKYYDEQVENVIENIQKED